jgi:hypothetical protein
MGERLARRRGKGFAGFPIATDAVDRRKRGCGAHTNKMEDCCNA